MSAARSLGALAGCVLLAICTEMSPVGLLPEIGASLHVSTSTTGLLVSLYAVLVALGSVPLAALAQRWPRKRVLAVLMLTYAASNVLFAAAPDYGVALAARAIGGITHAAFFAVVVAAAVALVEPARAGRAVAVVMAGNAIALAFGVPLATILGTALGWRWTFAAFAAVMCGLAGVVIVTLPADGAVAERSTPVLRAARRPALRLHSLVIALLALGHFSLYTYVSSLLLSDGVARPDIGLVLFGYGVGGVIGLAAASLVVARRPEQGFAAAIILMAASLLLAAAVSSTAGAALVVGLWGVAFGAFPTLSQTVTLRAAADASDAASALVNATTNIGIAGGAVLGAALLGPLPVHAIGYVGAALVAASLLVYVSYRRRLDQAAGRGTQSAREVSRG